MHTRTHARLTSALAVIAAMAAFPAAAALAAGPPALNSPAPAVHTEGRPTEGMNAPIVKWLRSQGAALTPLGLTGGMAGWLVQKDGHMQTIYVTPDGKHLIAGIMAGIGGSDVTALQLEAAVITHTKTTTGPVKAPAATAFPPAAAAHPHEGHSATSSHAPSPTATTSKPALKPTASKPAASKPASKPAQKPKPKAEPAASPVSLENPGDNATPLAHLKPAVFEHQVMSTANFTVGYPGLPDLVMVADPTCPVCHASWTLLAPLVASHRIDVTLVLIDALPNSTTDAVDLLGNPNVGQAWLKGEGSQAGVPIPVVHNQHSIQLARGYLKDNEKFAYKAKVDATPTLFWRSKSGEVYRGVGLKGVAGFITAVGNHAVRPEPPGKG